MGKHYNDWLASKVDEARKDVASGRLMTLEEAKNKLRRHRIERELNLMKKIA